MIFDEYLYIRRTEVLLLFSVTIAIPPRIDLNIKIKILDPYFSKSPVKVEVVVSPGDPLRLLWRGQSGAGQVDVTTLLNKNISVAMNFSLNIINHQLASFLSFLKPFFVQKRFLIKFL